MGHFVRDCRSTKKVKTTELDSWSSSKASRIVDASEKALCAIVTKEYLWDYLRSELGKGLRKKRISDLNLRLQSLEEFKQPEVNEYGPRNSSLKPTTVCDRESDNSKENTDDSLKQQHKTVTETSSVKSPLKVDKDWKEKLGVRLMEEEVEPIPKVEKKTAIPTATKKESVKTEKPIRRSVRHVLSVEVLSNSSSIVLKSHQTYGSKSSLNEDWPKNLDAQANVLEHSTSLGFQRTLMVVMLLLVEEQMEEELLAKVFFLRTKDETSEILKNFIKEIENLVDKKVKIIRSDNGTKFKNNVIDEFCREKGIKREYSVAMTPQQNGVAERKNRTLIEAARTMLADSKLPTTFWAKAVSTASYVQNRVLIVKALITALLMNSLGEKKSDEGFFGGILKVAKLLGYNTIRTRKVQENLHVGFLENKPMLEGNGPKWLFDLDSLTQSMNYVPVVAGTFSNDSAGMLHILMMLHSISIMMAQIQDQDGTHDDCSLQNNGTADQQVNTASPEVNTGSREVSTVVPEVNTATPEDLMGPIPTSEDTQVEDQEIELGISFPHSYASSVSNKKDDNFYSELGFLGCHFEGKDSPDLHTCSFCFVSFSREPKRVSKALSDPAWVEAMQEELL
ncbi:putative ribonuclease H-like domain-containing protein [Tanacetum coccineum]